MSENLGLMQLVNEAQADEDGTAFTVHVWLVSGQRFELRAYVPEKGYNLRHTLLRGDRLLADGWAERPFAIGWSSIIALEIEWG